MNIWKDRVTTWAREKPSCLAIYDENLSISYSELLTYTDEIGELLLRTGVHPQSRVVVILPRGAISAVILISLLKQGIVGLFLDPKSTHSELKGLIQSIQPAAVISPVLDPGWNVTLELNLNLRSPYLKPKIFFLPVETEKLSPPENLSWLLHTSGTTGAAKSVMISGENLVQRAQSEISDFSLKSDSKILNCLPYTHDLGLNQVLTALYVGATLEIKSKSISPLRKHLSDISLTGLTGTPLLWLDFLRTPAIKSEFPHLRYLTISGGRLDKESVRTLQDVFPNARILKTYGQTETFRTFLSEDINSDSLGRLISGVNIEITSEGELIHFGQTRMLGYLFDSEASRIRTANSERYGEGICTRDLVERSEGGAIHFLGRLDDSVKRFEQRFHLYEVELFLKSFPEVHDAAAVTIPTASGDWRQFELDVFVQRKINAEVTGAELLERCRSGLSYFKVPDSIRFLAQFPQTSSLKIDKRMLSQLAKRARVPHG